MAIRIMIVGEGGREAAMARALATARPKPDIIIAPGNAGTALFGRNIELSATDVPALVALARQEQIDVVVPGGEAPLVAGLADALAEAGIACAGPTRDAAELEGSKAFARTLAHAVGAPSPYFVVTRRVAELAWAVNAWDGIPVVKADGLASGKGVFLPQSKDECIDVGRRLLAGEIGPAGREIVVEERLVGDEASLFFACDGERVVALPHAKDYKRIRDFDEGENTGGMGAVSPNPHVTDELVRDVQGRIVEPVLRELARRGAPFRGFLYAGLMLTADGPKLLEFNVRLGDPEAQAILPRLAPGDFLRLCLAIGKGRLDEVQLTVEAQHTCAVVLAAQGYPAEPRTGDGIAVSEAFESPARWLDLAGAKEQDGILKTSAGRVAAVVGRGVDLGAARGAAYAGVPHVIFAGAQFRGDIGAERTRA